MRVSPLTTIKCTGIGNKSWTRCVRVNFSASVKETGLDIMSHTLPLSQSGDQTHVTQPKSWREWTRAAQKQSKPPEANIKIASRYVLYPRPHVFAFTSWKIARTWKVLFRSLTNICFLAIAPFAHSSREKLCH